MGAEKTFLTTSMAAKKTDGLDSVSTCTWQWLKGRVIMIYDRAKLQAKLVAPPYNAKTNAQAYTDINAANVSNYGLVPRGTLFQVAAGRISVRLERGSNGFQMDGITPLTGNYSAPYDTVEVEDIMGMCAQAIRMFTAPDVDFDTSDPSNLGMLGALKAAGVLDAADETKIIEAGNHPVSEAVEEGIVRGGECKLSWIEELRPGQ